MNKDIKAIFDKYMCDKNIVKAKIDRVIRKQKPKSYNVLIPSITAICLIFLFFIGNYLINTPYSYVSIDINPSIILTTNRFDKVIAVKGLNEDAELLLKNINVKNMKINDANNLILKKAIELEYIKENIDDNAILVTVYCNNESKRNKMQKSINNDLNEYFNGKGIKSLIINQVLTAEDINIMNEYGVSQGKVLFVKKAIAENPSLKFEDLIYMPVREIAKYIDGYENVTGNGQNFKDKGDGQNGNGKRNCKNN